MERVALHLFQCSFILAGSFYDLLYRSLTHFFVVVKVIAIFKCTRKRYLFLFLATDNQQSYSFFSVVYPNIKLNSHQIQEFVDSLQEKSPMKRE